MRMGQMIFAAGGGDPTRWAEHSILVSGHFDQERIFKAAVQNGAKVTEFKGVRDWCSHRSRVSWTRLRMCAGWR